MITNMAQGVTTNPHLTGYYAGTTQLKSCRVLRCREDLERKGSNSKDEKSSRMNCQDFNNKHFPQYQEHKEEAEI